MYTIQSKIGSYFCVRALTCNHLFQASTGHNKSINFCSSQKFHTSAHQAQFNRLLKSLGTRLSKDEINTALAGRAQHMQLDKTLGENNLCPVREIYVNQLPANKPLEDRWNVGLNQVDGAVSSLLFGVFDGHSGPWCAEVVNRASLEFVAASCLNPEKLESVLASFMEKDLGMVYTIVRILSRRHLNQRDAHMWPAVHSALLQYIRYLIEKGSDRNMDPTFCLHEALNRLDMAICSPALPNITLECTPKQRHILQMAMSGAVGLVGRIYWSQDSSTLHIANVGDCGAVLGSGNDPIAVPLSRAHTALNPDEVARLSREHPQEMPGVLLKEARLLGELAPTRSFGDVRYKWTTEQLHLMAKQVNLPGNYPILPNNYITPPYLTAEPEIMQHDINPEDRFLILASDGLWDTMDAQTAVSIVSQALNDPKKPPLAVNPATLLLKHALSTVIDPIKSTVIPVCAADGIPDLDYKRISTQLSLQLGVARYFRDDITVMVLRFAPPTTSNKAK